jgi:alkylation response protein AidB-like acyl-CoA dehydrogenase
MLPEEYGGGGSSAFEGVVLYEELGRSLAPTPHFVSAVMSGGVLVRGANKTQRDEWLPRIISGEAILTPAWLEPESSFGPKGVQLRAASDGGEWELNGTKRHVAFAQAADAAAGARSHGRGSHGH